MIVSIELKNCLVILIEQFSNSQIWYLPNVFAHTVFVCIVTKLYLTNKLLDSLATEVSSRASNFFDIALGMTFLRKVVIISEVSKEVTCFLENKETGCPTICSIGYYL